MSLLEAISPTSRELLEYLHIADWVSQFVVCIETVPQTGRGVTLTVTAEHETPDEKQCIVISRTGQTHLDALRKCVRHGLTQFPLKPGKQPERNKNDRTH